MVVTDEAIGALVRAMRRKKNISQPDLGLELGVGEQMIQKYETGQSPLTVVKLVTTAKFLRCKITDLIPWSKRGGA